MIPVIGTAVMKNPHWVKRLYESIDYPVENFIIFNNYLLYIYCFYNSTHNEFKITQYE